MWCDVIGLEENQRSYEDFGLRINSGYVGKATSVCLYWHVLYNVLRKAPDVE